MIGNKKLGFVGATVALVVAALFAPCASAEEFPKPVLSSLEKALGIYEQVRVELVADQLERVPAHALRLAGAFRLAAASGAGLAEEVSDVVKEAGRAAESLAEAETLSAARVAFGEVSRGLMLLADRDPRLVEDWYVFACPMVVSFAKWLQPTEELENPYMGPAMPKCGLATDWSVPAPPAAKVAAKEAAPGTDGFSGPEPEFKAGIPGLKMVDVRDHKFLWREIDELQIWEHGERISVAEYRSKAIEKTAHFLELEGTEADAFVATAAEVVDGVRKSFRNRKVASAGTAGLSGRFSSDLAAAVTRLTSLLQDEPRHHLFAPGSKKWLLKLAFAPRESREAKGTSSAR